jgi:hypothetical protein
MPAAVSNATTRGEGLAVGYLFSPCPVTCRAAPSERRCWELRCLGFLSWSRGSAWPKGPARGFTHEEYLTAYGSRGDRSLRTADSLLTRHASTGTLLRAPRPLRGAAAGSHARHVPCRSISPRYQPCARRNTSGPGS